MTAEMPDKEELIRIRAHEIWEREGRPAGEHERHWDLAMAEIAEEEMDLLNEDDEMSVGSSRSVMSDGELPAGPERADTMSSPAVTGAADTGGIPSRMAVKRSARR